MHSSGKLVDNLPVIDLYRLTSIHRSGGVSSRDIYKYIANYHAFRGGLLLFLLSTRGAFKALLLPDAAAEEDEEVRRQYVSRRVTNLYCKTRTRHSIIHSLWLLTNELN